MIKKNCQCMSMLQWIYIAVHSPAYSMTSQILINWSFIHIGCPLEAIHCHSEHTELFHYGQQNHTITNTNKTLLRLNQSLSAILLLKLFCGCFFLIIY